MCEHESAPVLYNLLLHLVLAQSLLLTSLSHVFRAEYDSAAESIDSETGAPRGWDPAAHIALDDSVDVLPMRDFIVCKRGRSKEDYKQIVQVRTLMWTVL
jgi:hypothetical protein